MCGTDGCTGLVPRVSSISISPRLKKSHHCREGEDESTHQRWNANASHFQERPHSSVLKISPLSPVLPQAVRDGSDSLSSRLSAMATSASAAIISLDPSLSWSSTPSKRRAAHFACVCYRRGDGPWARITMRRSGQEIDEGGWWCPTS